MKKLLALLLALVMVLSLCACGMDDDRNSENPDSNTVSESETEEITEPTNNAAVESYIANNREVLLSSMEESFATSSGMTCTSTIEAEGDGFVITMKINELEDVDAAAKAQMQSAYDQSMEVFNQALTMMQNDVPELKYYKVLVCEKDGDLLAEIHAK